ncbi:hypothetical protein GW750_02260 [bacterium]|nr:hypothetical protein [bacterium]
MRQAILYPYTAEYFVSDMFESCTFDTKLSDVATMLKRQKFVPIKSINLSYIGVCSYETIARYFIYKSQH